MLVTNKEPMRGELLEELCKNYNACVEVIMSRQPFDENMKRIFTELCHIPVEQTLYDAIVYGMTSEEIERKETFESIVEKGVELYYLHSMFNKKLDRVSYGELEERDDCLLYCIVSEMKRRNPELKGIVLAHFNRTDKEWENNLLQDAIYAKYLETDLGGLTRKLHLKKKSDEFTDFNQYVDYLIGLKTSLNDKRNSFHYIWTNTTGHHRSATFHSKRPSKEELYIFCIGAAFDYSVFCRLKSFLIEEIEQGKLLKGDNPEKAAKRKEKYLEEDERDIVLRMFLKNINSRLLFASEEVKGIADFIPRRMLENVNTDLDKYKLKTFRLNGRPKKQ